MPSGISEQRRQTMRRLTEKIRDLAPAPVCLMEVCGTHTMAIGKAGIRQLLPPQVRLLSGPGCPVCVTPPEGIDRMLRLSEEKQVIIATYGDMIRVPGSRRGDTLSRRRAAGARVAVVYSVMDALQLAGEHPDDEIVFPGIGFETSAPGTAAAIQEAARRDLRNFTVLPMMKTTGPALRALIRAPDFSVQGFLCPGHVAAITGEEGFRFLAEEYAIPAVISGFEPEDILASVFLLLSQIREGRARLENEYTRAVSKEGNALARTVMHDVLLPRDDSWRGLGLVKGSGLTIREAYSRFNAEERFRDLFTELPEPSAETGRCRCGQILQGHLSPGDCPLFGTVCTPEDPVGPCMVSGEGACAAAYRYESVHGM